MGITCTNCQHENSDETLYCGQCAAPLKATVGITLTKTLITHEESLQKGSTITGKYQILEELGRGGMGVVYKAEDIKLQRMVALKFLPHQLGVYDELKERFMIEAQAAAALSHPNICVIHEVGESEGRSYIAMEYVAGETLKDKIKKNTLTTEDALPIMNQLAAGLDEAHCRGIIHRDIKCANIMVTDKGQAKIMDFGLAKLQEGSGLTKSQTTMGTVAYMSPEQARGEKVDSRSDIWSLGVVFYEMLSGQLPFPGGRESAVLYSVVHEEPRPIKEIKPELPSELQRIINRALKKKPGSRYSSAAAMLSDLNKYQDILHAEKLGVFNLKTLLRRVRKPRVAIPAIGLILLIAATLVWNLNRQAKIRWAREALPNIEQLIDKAWRNYYEPYELAVLAEKYIPEDPKLAELFARCSFNISIKTEPQGADIYIKEYEKPESEWEYLGVSPLEEFRLPWGFFRLKMEKDGYEIVYAASSSWNITLAPNDTFFPIEIERVLDETSSMPEGMVRVAGEKTPFGQLDDFFIDRYEVTNEQYKEFMGNSGYRNKAYWKHEFVKEGKTLTWEGAMSEFVDQTDQPGPSTWEAGDYSEGKENYPVSGISWYEAAAYAEFAGKSLPTVHHWGIARGEYIPMIMGYQLGGNAIFAPFSNFKGKGPDPVGHNIGMTAYGAYDMPGNVREWCWNETQIGRCIRGGAWTDNNYLFEEISQSFPFDRSPINGFRCALYLDPEHIPESALAMFSHGETIDFYKAKPVPDSIFEVYKAQFSYDKTDLNAQVEVQDESSKNWIEEKITFDAAYSGERMIAILFLPKNATPPHQTVIYFPGAQARFRTSSREIASSMEFELFLSFIVKNGRAVMYPIYKGTMERREDAIALSPDESLRKRDYRIIIIKDFQRCIDYLETRPDIDSQKLVYLGMSWGGWLGNIIPAVEERLVTSILIGGHLVGGARPEVDDITYLPRVKIPTLMMNGRYDKHFDTKIVPMFDLMGTPDEHKDFKVYDTDHIPPRNEFIKETLTWLDRYLGPVN